MDFSNFQTLCSDLDSAKVTMRKNICDTLQEVLRKKESVEFLNDGGDRWSTLLTSLIACMKRDHDKKLDEVAKRRVEYIRPPPSADVFALFVRMAVKEHALDFHNLLEFIMTWLKDPSKQMFQNIFLKILSEHILIDSYVRNLLKESDWRNWFSILVTLCKNNKTGSECFKCLAVIVKVGPLYTFPVGFLRDQIKIVGVLCETINSVSLSVQQEAMVQLVFEFCRHTAKDNRAACCQLGEEVFSNLVDIFQGNNDMKAKIVEFFLLQVALHNPNGAKSASETWKHCLSTIFDILNNEIDMGIQMSVKNPSIFICQDGVNVLLNNFVDLFVRVSQQLFYRVDDDIGDGEPAMKRQKTDSKMGDLINNVMIKKSWAWLNLTYALIDACPHLITKEESLYLLETLLILYSDTDDKSLIVHIYKSFVVLLKLEKGESSSWKCVSDIVLRHMNESNEIVQTLLQLLIEKNHFSNYDVLLQQFTPGGAITMDEYNIKTLDVAFRTFQILQCDKTVKRNAIQWILSSNCRSFCLRETAEILISLIMKQWSAKTEFKATETRRFGDFENIISITNYENLIELDETIKLGEKAVTCIDQTLLDVLLERLNELLTEVKLKSRQLLNAIELTFNVMSYLDDLKILQDLEELDVFQSLNTSLTNLFEFVNFNRSKYDEKTIIKLINYSGTLNSLFGNRSSGTLSKVLRQLAPENVIREMFQVLNLEPGNSISPLRLHLKMNIIESLMNFSCCGSRLQIQDKAFQALLKFDYDYDDDDQFELAMTLMRCLKRNRFEPLSEDNLNLMFNLLQKICAARYYCYENVVEILDLYKDIYTLVASSAYSSCKSQFVEILLPFYKRCKLYSADVSVNLLKCMGLLFELEPACLISKWNNEDIVLKIPEFLNSDYHEVRLATIKMIAKFFQVSSKMRVLEQFHRQEIMFSKITDICFSALDFSYNECRQADERTVRFSSVLHTFASIMIVSNLWIEESLYTLLKITSDKNLEMKDVKKILEAVARKLGFTSGLTFLEKYLLGITNRWKAHKFVNLPFKMFNCNSKIHLFQKYWSLLGHVVIESEINILNQMSLENSRIEHSCQKFLSYALAQEASNLDLIGNNVIYKFVKQTLGEKELQGYVKDRFEQIFLNLIEFVSDEQHFSESFNQSIIFPKMTGVCLSVENFLTCLRFIESNFFNGESAVTFLMQRHSEKVYFILLQLNVATNTVHVQEEKIRLFHLYSIFVSLCIDLLPPNTTTQDYLLREVTYTLLNVIKSHKLQPDLGELSCKVFQKTMEKMLSLNLNLAQFFRIIISRLKYVALEDTRVSQFCLKMLELLIIDHSALFTAEIEQLDSIPNTEKFLQISNIHRRIKYNHHVSLEEEITHFLTMSENVEVSDECEHSLTHLKTSLMERKTELGEMYDRLRATRGSSDDCESSSLHKLICMLINLCCSGNSRVRREAGRCLGEIGAADLATMILRPEKKMLEVKWSPVELVFGVGVSLLEKYVVDEEVGVVRCASLALFKIMEVKEGRKVLGNDFGFGNINSRYLTPFCSPPLRKRNFSFSVKPEAFEKLKHDTLWCPGSECHKTWITALVCAILESFEESDLFSALISIAKLKTEFCEQIFPLLVNAVVFLNITSFTDLISAQIANFFDTLWDITVKNESRPNITANMSSVQCMLNVVHFVRLQRSLRKMAVKDLKLNYLKVAKGAHFCTAYFTALLYAELWCQEQVDEEPDAYCESTCTYTKLDLIYERVDELTKNTLQTILRQSYQFVGETDAILGCGTFHLLNLKTRVDHYKQSGKWSQVVHYYDMEYSRGSQHLLRPLVESLKNENLYQLSLFCSEALQEPNYECMWRLGQWDYSENNLTASTYEKCKFYALKALKESEGFSFVQCIDEGRECVVKQFVGANVESVKNFYDTFAKLQCLKEIEDFAEGMKEERKIEELVMKWKVQDEIVSNDYRYVEELHSQRILLLSDLLREGNQKGELKELVADTIISYAEFARIEGKFHVAFRILENLMLVPLSNEIRNKIQLEQAQVCWSIQDVVSAKCILRQLCNNENVNARLHAMALKLTGQYMVESSSENRQTVIEEYFQKSLQLIRNCQRTPSDEQSIVDISDRLAKFADHEYQAIMAHVKSDGFHKKCQNVQKSKASVSRANDLKKTRDLQKAITIKKKFTSIDEVEINAIETEKNDLLRLALKYYLTNLVRSDTHNMTIFRLFSLLLENRNANVVKSILEQDFMKIPTYKFISILPQIVPHISNDAKDVFSKIVNALVEKCAIDHPYHTLPLILALAFSNKDREYSESKAANNDARIQSAKNIIQRLRKQKKLCDLLKRMEKVSEAVIELAYLKTEGTAGKSVKVPRKALIQNIQGFEDVLVPTYNLGVEKSGNYRNIVGIVNFSDVYYNVGGINVPKRITCTGSDGLDRTLLIKGQDDLRQDAVMQQVFTIMNSLLNMNKQRKNFGRIRTYKIVPLSMRSGILEWVDNTMPIGDYLVGERGDGGAHVRFRPMDRRPNKCRDDFRLLATNSNEERLRGFRRICEKFQPVFHHFFETNFLQPTVWYERRRTYIHSVATSSMCGYILGIGDRHVNNILIDKSSAEVVHIDFGIAFEQGRVLPTPETIPFRLTRDIVDGMGVSGVEGVFRRSCEKTVEVFRLHNQTIITILEVLLYDPLYDWTVSSAEANKRQKAEQDDEFNSSLPGNSDENAAKDVNETAERALLRLRAKLSGLESGKFVSVETQVGSLIQQAVDPSNLCRLYQGWQPYL